MTRSELQTKLIALSGAGDACATDTLEWIDELSQIIRDQAQTIQRLHDQGVPLGPLPVPVVSPALAAANASLLEAAQTFLARNPPDIQVAAAASDFGPPADPVAMGKGEALPPSARNGVAVGHVYPQAETPAPPPLGDPGATSELVDGYGVPFGPEVQERHRKGLLNLNELHKAVVAEGMILSEAEQVAAAATRKANGLPEAMDEDVVKAHGDTAGKSFPEIPNGGTGEG